MGRSADEISREIADTRDDMERRIIALRERGQRTMHRGIQVVIGVAAVTAAATAAFIVWRATRPPTWQERVARSVPKGWRGTFKDLYDKGELTLRRGMPPVRLYVNDRQVGQQPATSTMEKIIIRAAQAAGTAAAGALANRLFQQASGRGRSRNS